MELEKKLSCYPDLHETRTDTRISQRYSARESGRSNMAARFPGRNIELLQLHRIGTRILTVKRLL